MIRMKRNTTITDENNTGYTGMNGKKNNQQYRNEQSCNPANESDFEIVKFESIDGEEKENFEKICILRNTISSYLFEYLHGFHIPTYFISKRSGTEMSVKKTERIPLLFKIFNSANGQLAKRFGLKEGVNIEFPIIEHYYLLNTRGNSWVNEYHVYGLGISTPEEFKQMNRIAAKVNAVLRGLCDRRQLHLGELNLMFGRSKGQILLCGEISPATCQFFDASGEQKHKRDKYTLEQNNAVESLIELAERLMVKV